MDLLKNRVAVITGAGKGLGKTFAMALAECGVNVALVGRNADSLKQVGEIARRSEMASTSRNGAPILKSCL